MNAHAAINIITEHYHYHYCFRVDGPKRLKNSTCEHGFFLQTEKKIPVLKEPSLSKGRTLWYRDWFMH